MEVAGSPSARVHAHSSSSELSAHQMPQRRSHVLLKPTGADVPLGDAAWHTSGLGDVSRWPLRAHRNRARADVDRRHALICTGATARPGRDRNTGRRGASIQEQIVAVEVGYDPVIMQFAFQQSFLFTFLDVSDSVQFQSATHFSCMQEHGGRPSCELQ